MSDHLELRNAIVDLDHNTNSFEQLALEVFRYQYANNEVYKQYVDFLGRNTFEINRIEKIPFLPIEFFKSHKILSTTDPAKAIFESSGTTSSQTSKHYVTDLNLYDFLSRKTFESMYGHMTDYHIFALLPSYLERSNSSLIYMVRNFILDSYSSFSNFYQGEFDKLIINIKEAAKDNRKILLIGVSFALLDLAENNDLSEQLRVISDKLVVMETGGMKGKRKELTREELHGILTKAFGLKNIHSEYGMTELLSQAYSTEMGLFSVPNQMKILLREVNDPFSYIPGFAIGNSNESKRYRGKTGGINIIDLANIYSCSFIETKDLGSYSEDYKHFKVMGRFDSSDVRGCNLLLS
jgi:hypothetical protein